MSLPEWTPTEEMYELVSKYCDEQLSEADADRLTSLLRADWRVRAFLVEYVQLHAQLAWEGAALNAVDFVSSRDSNQSEQTDHSELGGVEQIATAVETTGSGTTAAGAARATGSSMRSSRVGRDHESDPASRRNESKRSESTSRRSLRAMLAVGSLAGVILILNLFRGSGTENGTVETQSAGGGGTELASNGSGKSGDATGQESQIPPEPLRLEGLGANRRATTVAPTGEEAVASAAGQATGTVGIEEPSVVEIPDSVVAIPDSDDEIIAQIDAYLRKSVDETETPVAQVASDQEWVRRAYVTFTGRIPSVAESRQFLSFPAGRRRSVMIDVLAADERTAENLSVNWLNLLIGRSNPRQVNEDSLYTFLSEQFRNNRPWIETVGKLISAEGRSDENGATNFLLAHLNDQATPATAVTARLFLGEQVHCTQCHNHPFAKELTQDHFWELNAFFKQAERRPVMQADGQPMPGGVFELIDHENGGMTFYETRRGQQVAVLPEFAGVRLPKEDGVHRRSELAKLLEQDPDHRVARSMVNRMWQHFFGFGFTMPVDDMGPHNPVSHPELLDFLSRAFVKSGYDTKKLMYWIASTDAWQRSSTMVDGSEDVPEAGGIPQFTRVYARHLDPEEVYDSIRVAIRSVSGQPLTSSVGTDHRREWVRQFVESYGTDENDESVGFEGNISQALMMMNGEDLEQAIPAAVRTMLRSYEGRAPSPGETLEQISMATVSRQPTEDEVKAFRHRVRTLNGEVADEDVLRIALEDMFWAYLNSTEFSLNH